MVAIDVRGHGDSGRLSSGIVWNACTIDPCELARVVAPAADTPIGMVGQRFAWLTRAVVDR